MENPVVREKTFRAKVMEKVTGIFLIEPVSFSAKKRINFRGLAWLLCGALGIFVALVFLLPSPQEQTRNFNEQKPLTAPSPASVSPGQSITGITGGLPGEPLNPSAIRSYLQTRSGATGVGNGGGRATAVNRNTSMIIPRDNDSSTTLPPGTKFSVKLAQNVTVTNRPIPVIGVVTSSISGRSSIAIPEDSQIYGEAVLDQDSERAAITWKSIQFPDGRAKPLNAIALGADNQAGVEGTFHSDAAKNTAGMMISRFVGGFAEGAINRGALGANQGGVQNGLLQGAADTAKDRAEAWSEDLKKPREWIELEAGARFQSILSQPFVFRDPGGIN